ncbi:MBL fold metallo-hydrolase [Hymenobacter sp. UV11]|uniref:MBL fold metallo-hydrolase n=1 Tax=Hymenobacter sp. UV11 TaxID=1849735 RepID=UPI00105C2561|nr:MBL fold metallo-hydrolase [Hymenobacter sp. UV11]TDN37827.1 hypothetical protein A8B98_01840 [Hymenobacter sp. UV11]TFZ62289.1 MBL fold metallo-hydrolase [Hymenobacter sp. UV11]
MAVVQLTPRVWQLKLNLVNCYLLETEDGLLLIDTGYPNSADKRFAAVRESGHDPALIRHLLLTHCHIDHGGSAAEVQRRTGARTYAHALDAPLIGQGIAERPGTTRTPGLVNRLVYLFFIKYAGTTYDPLPVDEPLAHGQVLPLAGGLEVIHSPGHSAGHLCLLLRSEGLLIAGDICSHVMGLKYSTINEDRTLARQSILRVAEYPFERAAFGHGDALTERANQQLKEAFAAS